MCELGIGVHDFLYRAIEYVEPIPNGRTMPPNAIDAESRTLRLITFPSISRPTRKRNNTSPMLATRERKGKVSLGNICFVNPGIRPNAVGPKRIPPRTSAITFGWRIFLRIKESSCVVNIITPIVQNFSSVPRWKGVYIMHQLG